MSVLLAIFSLAMVFGLMVACTEPVESVSIVVIAANGEVLVEIEASDFESNLVVDILTEHNDRLQIPQSELNSGFVSTIAGVMAEWNCRCSLDVAPTCEEDRYWWVFEINQEMAAFGIRYARVNDGDEISFRKVSG